MMLQRETILECIARLVRGFGLQHEVLMVLRRNFIMSRLSCKLYHCQLVIELGTLDSNACLPAACH